MTDKREYGRALFLLSEEFGNTERVKEDAECIRAVLRENPGFVKLLDTPALPKEEKLGIIDKTLSQIEENLKNLIKILCERHCVYMLSGALDGFSLAYDESRGIERVEALSAVALTDEQLAKLKVRLEGLSGKQIIIRNTVDSSILGGMKLRYMGIQLDGSVKTKLERFEKSLCEIVI